MRKWNEIDVGRFLCVEFFGFIMDTFGWGFCVSLE